MSIEITGVFPEGSSWKSRHDLNPGLNNLVVVYGKKDGDEDYSHHLAVYTEHGFRIFGGSTNIHVYWWSYFEHCPCRIKEK